MLYVGTNGVAPNNIVRTGGGNYLAGDGIDITNNVISITDDVLIDDKEVVIDQNTLGLKYSTSYDEDVGDICSQLGVSYTNSDNETSFVKLFSTNYLSGIKFELNEANSLLYTTGSRDLVYEGRYIVSYTTPYRSAANYIIPTIGYLRNNYADGSSLVYNTSTYSLESKGIKNTETTSTSDTLRIWEGTQSEYNNDVVPIYKYWYGWVGTPTAYSFQTESETPEVGDLAWNPTHNGTPYEISEVGVDEEQEFYFKLSVTGDNKYYRYQNRDEQEQLGGLTSNDICFIEGVGVKTGTGTVIANVGGGGAAYTAGTGIDITSNVISVTTDSVPTSGSSNPITSGAVYNALGDIETALDAIIAQGSNS